MATSIKRPLAAPRAQIAVPADPIHPVTVEGVPKESEALTIAAAVEMFFGDLRLAPRSKKTYRHGITKFVRHLERHEGLDPAAAPVTTIRPDHVAAFATLLVPPDVRTPEEVSKMRTAQNNLSAVRKFCAYLSAYELHPDLATDRLRVGSRR